MTLSQWLVCSACNHPVHQHDDEQGCCAYVQASLRERVQVCACPVQMPEVDE